MSRVIVYISFCLLALQSCFYSKEELDVVKSDSIPVRGVIGGHEYVDLGLSVLWATSNVSVDPNDTIGDFVSYGELKHKDLYLPNNYTHYDTLLTEISGSKYDYATHVWGGGWRTPTYVEYDELFKKCEHHWNENLKAFVAVGPSGDSICFYAYGYKYDNEHKQVNYGGYYWSSTLNVYYPEYAWRLGFIPIWQGMDDVGLYYGYQVRAVIDK